MSFDLSSFDQGTGSRTLYSSSLQVVLKGLIDYLMRSSESLCSVLQNLRTLPQRSDEKIARALSDEKTLFVLRLVKDDNNVFFPSFQVVV